jgi:hypothetical protein
VIVTLAWKEYREHRSIWLTMVIMTVVLGYGLALLISAGETNTAQMLGTSALSILGMAVTYGAVCGAMMFAGERESGTLVFLDIFLGRRGLLWLGKFLIGVVLAVSEALAVAGALHFLRQSPPDWLPTLIGEKSLAGFLFPGADSLQASPVLWYRVLPVVTLEAYAWGLLGSSLTQRVVTGAALAALLATPLWLVTLFAPPPVFLGMRLAGAAIALFISHVVFLVQSRETLVGPPLTLAEKYPLRRREESWQGADHLDRRRRSSQGMQEHRSRLDIPLDVILLDDPAPRTERSPHTVHRQAPAQARSAAQVLWWLTFRQARLLLGILAGVAVVVGMLLPSGGQVLWPMGTLFLGIACGTAAFAQEQRDLSYQFLAGQHVPLKRFWTVKIVFWFTAAVLIALFAVGSGAVVVLLQNLATKGAVPVRPGQIPGPFPPAPRPAPAPSGFDFGPLAALLGPVLFFGAWLVYGFCMGQVLVLYCRKNVLAVLLSTLTCAAVLALWLPSLLCGGMAGWQLWLPPVVLLLATRLLMRAWAGGRIKERRPLAAISGFSLAALVWLGLNLGYRAFAIPDVGEPLDRKEFSASFVSGNNNLAGQKFQQALGEIDKPEGKEGPWLPRIAEAAALPPGMIDNPPGAGPPPVLRHLPACRKITEKLREVAQAAFEHGKPGVALDHLAQILALSRTLRNKAPLASYLAGIEIEASALQGLDTWLAHKKPSRRLLRRALAELNRHAAETPHPRECLKAECYRTGGLLDTPAAWTFAAGRGAGRVSQRWLERAIALSLEMPWEEERKIRLWQVVWAGLFRAIETPFADLPETAEELQTAKEPTRHILEGWLPASEGPDASLTQAQLARLLDASWLADERLFVSVVPLRAAATRARWRVDACRLELALALYQLGNRKPAGSLNELVPHYLPHLPLDPYSGKDFHYRISKGEEIDVAGPDEFQGRKGAARGTISQGQGLLWSTGPDRVDHGGRKHGGALADGEPEWSREGFDLVTVVPYWP